jgi:Ser/Thr protein kinase RdoA (MazF antagonist)
MAMYDSAFLARLYGMLRQALPSWSLAPDSELSLLTISENATYRVYDAAADRTLILRVHRPDYHSPDEIASELMWIDALRASGVASTPAPVAGADGSLLYRLHDGVDSRYVAAFDFVEGRSPDQDDDLVGWFRRLGAISAKLHIHARAWQRPAGFVRKIWNFDTMIGATPHWGRWTAGLGLDDAGRALLTRAVAKIRDCVDRFGMAESRFGLVHADLRLANLLVNGDQLHLIDFDDCGFSWFIYDFAAAVSFFEHEPIIPALMDAWIQGYRSVLPLSAEEAAMIPVFVMVRRIMLVAWIASHSETPTAQELGIPYTEGSLVLADRFLTEFA